MGCNNAKQHGDYESPKKATVQAPPTILANNDLASGELKFQEEEKERLVMGRYKMGMGKQALMGEGAFSICRKGIDVKNGDSIAIKVYKDKSNAKNGKAEQVIMKKFIRQIEVLQKLQEPLESGSDPSLWHPALETVQPSSLFMILLDYSKGPNGAPQSDADSGVVYVVTELAQYSLKDYLGQRREQQKPLAMDVVKSITRAILLVIAGLHAKGLVHIDLKPENLMVFKGRVKLIDLDGCVKVDSQVSIKDSSISFSPCYCSPEWARFLIDENLTKIQIRPALDVWSVGMTICELVTLKPAMKNVYLNFLRNARSHQETGFLFLEWLSHVREVPLASQLRRFDPDFVNLMNHYLLVSDKEKRKTCAEALDSPFVYQKVHADAKAVLLDEVIHTNRSRPVDASTAVPIYKGRLWKLNANGKPSDPTQWLQRDMWLAQQGSLCYFSTKEKKRLVLVDGAKLANAQISPYEGGHRSPAFEVKWHEDRQNHSMILAADTFEQFDEWMSALKGAERMDHLTMRLGDDISELRQLVVRIQNRRQKVDYNAKDEFQPVYKGMLWKLSADGDASKPDHWFEREMWIANNGSLVYYSKKEERELVYYTPADLIRATYSDSYTDASHIHGCNPRTLMHANNTCKPWSFQVNLPATNDVEFAPGNFAANTKELADRWVRELTGSTKRISER